MDIGSLSVEETQKKAELLVQGLVEMSKVNLNSKMVFLFFI